MNEVLFVLGFCLFAWLAAYLLFEGKESDLDKKKIITYSPLFLDEKNSI